MSLNPYVWGTDSIRGVVDNVRLHLSDNPDDQQQAEQNSRDAEERWNTETD